MNIQGTTVLITGASRGIGRAIALQLAQQKAKKIILVARDRNKLAEVAKIIAAMDVEAVIMPLDLTKPTFVNVAVAQLWQSYSYHRYVGELCRCGSPKLIFANQIASSSGRIILEFAGNIHHDSHDGTTDGKAKPRDNC